MFRVIFMVLALSLAPLTGMAQDKPTFPQYYTTLTNDFADILTDEAETRINQLLLSARESRGLEMAVVTIRSRDDYAPSADITAFATKLFNGWGIGNAERNDGILLLVAIEDREVRIALGAGYPARQDGIAARIIQTEIIPAFREGRVADGIYNGTRAAIGRLTTQAAAPQPAPAPVPAPAVAADREPVIEQPPEPQSIGLFTRISEAMGRFTDDYPILAIILGALTAVAGFFGIKFGSQWRPRKCPECGRVMLRLGEAQEDQYLDYGQLVEERIKSKNYGVWFCPEDEHVTVKGFRRMFDRHTACPECNYHTLETRRTVLSAATTVSMGIAQLDHSCRNCNHTATEKVSIPKLPRNNSGSGRRSSGFRSSSSGGSSSFGGGRSSGGGASGRW